jgi:hypothetical protein
MRLLKIIGVVLLGLVGLAVLLYGIGVAVNWRDQPPSAAVLEMKRLVSDRPAVADADNGFVYALGFGVPAAEDPQTSGTLRKNWMESVNRDPKQVDAAPVTKYVEFSTSVSQSVEGVKKSCGDSPSVKCRDAFLAGLAQPRMNLEDLQLARYRQLLERSAWREVVPLDLRVPLPAYGDILGGQRLLMIDLAARAKSAPPVEIASTLRADLEFWRGVLRSGDFLITKLIATSAIRQHFFFANLVLREMPAERARVIESWSVPFSVEELSMRRTMAGEFSFVEGVMLKYQTGADGYLVEPAAEGLTLPGRIASSLARPYYRHQDQMNFYAASYLDFAKRFEAPLEQYAQIAKNFESTTPPESSFHIYNPVGHFFRGVTGSGTYPEHPIRVGSIEGMRRAALLTAQLRERAVPLDQMAREVSSAELRNPFDGRPFEWSVEEQAVVYVGPEVERSRRKHPYFY